MRLSSRQLLDGQLGTLGHHMVHYLMLEFLYLLYQLGEMTNIKFLWFGGHWLANQCQGSMVNHYLAD